MSDFKIEVILLIAFLIITFLCCTVLGENARAYKGSNTKDIKLSSNNVATFTLEVVDSNQTLPSNQSKTPVNDTYKISMSCDPSNVKIYQGKLSKINCKVINTSYKNTDVSLKIMGLENSGIRYTINGDKNTDTISVPANTSEIMELDMRASDTTSYDIGKSYDYTIRASCSLVSDC